MDELIPVRCFTCNKVIASKWETYKELLQKTNDTNAIFQQIGFNRYCCKRMFLGQVQ